MTNTPPRKQVPQHDPINAGKLDPAFGQSAREFQWLVDETEAFTVLVRIESEASSNARKAALGHSVTVVRRPMPLLNIMIDACQTRKASL